MSSSQPHESFADILIQCAENNGFSFVQKVHDEIVKHFGNSHWKCVQEKVDADDSTTLERVAEKYTGVAVVSLAKEGYYCAVEIVEPGSSECVAYNIHEDRETTILGGTLTVFQTCLVFGLDEIDSSIETAGPNPYLKLHYTPSSELSLYEKPLKLFSWWKK